MMRFHHVKGNEGYQGLPWYPIVAGGVGYFRDGSATAYADLVIFRRFYIRLFEAKIGAFDKVRWNREYLNISTEMSSVSPKKQIDAISDVEYLKASLALADRLSPGQAERISELLASSSGPCLHEQGIKDPSYEQLHQWTLDAMKRAIEKSTQ